MVNAVGAPTGMPGGLFFGLECLFGESWMKRILVFAVAAATAAGASDLRAQERLSSRFDLGVYGGYGWTTPWFSADVMDEALVPVHLNFGIDGTPAFGATGTLWATPGFGFRMHGGYLPSKPPLGGGIPVAYADLKYPLNNYLADLSLAFRPLRGSEGRMAKSFYFWLGGGVLISDFAGEPVAECLPAYNVVGACVPYSKEYGSVGQGTAGFGFDLIPLGSRVAIFTEIGAHGYDSPVHSREMREGEFVIVEGAVDKFAVTGRASAGLKVEIGSIRTPVVPVPPAPPPPSSPPPSPPPPPADRAIQVCVVQNGGVQSVSATIRSATGDTVINGTRFAQAYPASAPNYAVGASWFIGSSELKFDNREWVKYGVARVVQPPQLQRAGEFQGTPVFAEAGATAPFTILYVPVRPGCEFQPYTPREVIRPRG
jgi:hypothetical protein